LRKEQTEVKNDRDLIRSQCHDELALLKSKVKMLSKKSDQILDSLTYIVSEYDDFNLKVSATTNSGQQNKVDISTSKCEVETIKSKQSLLDLEQYGKRENLEIHGVPIKPNESTNQIVKAVAKLLNVKLEDNHISTFHRLTGKMTPNLRVHAYN